MRQVSSAYIVLMLMTLFPLRLSAQGGWVVRGDCTPELTDGTALTRGVRHRLPNLKNSWDSTKVYRQMVVLVTFRDCDFQMEDPKATYDAIFNSHGYNQRKGPGCVADYFRDQSNGLCNFQFDIYGPIKVDTLACPVPDANEKTRNYGRAQFTEATKAVFAQHPDVDYRQYDWDGNGNGEQIIFVYAGLCGNQGAGSYGYIWPNTSTFNQLTAPDGTRFSDYTGSGELWKNQMSCGIGTICHEFTHSLGLPDIYPTTGSAGYSVVDEWDLMDGGNFTNYGWCPPNYSAMEKMLLGWLTPVELTDPASITDLKPSAEGGEVYQIKHSSSEWLLLENRQLRGWDSGAPGKGLVIYHVNYDRSVWQGNTVNNNKDKRRFELVNADGRDYDAWDVTIPQGSSPYQNSGRMNSYILSTSPYPWSTDSTTFVNDQLTETSVPPLVMHYPNEEGSMQLSKPITNIRMSDDGLVSFDFMGGKPDGLLPVVGTPSSPSVYNLQGQSVIAPRKGIYIRDRRKVIIH